MANVYSKKPYLVVDAFRSLILSLFYYKTFRSSPITYIDIGARGGAPLKWRILEKIGLATIYLVEADEEESIKLGKRFPKSILLNNALSDKTGTHILYITRKSYLSSLLEPLSDSSLPEKTAKTLEIIKEIPIVATRFDETWDANEPPPNFAKIDVQGFELNILKGMGDFLEHIWGVELEIRLERHYKKLPMAEDVYEFMRHNGFVPVKLHPNGFKDSERMVVFNAFFINTKYSKEPKISFWRKLNKISNPKRLKKWNY